MVIKHIYGDEYETSRNPKTQFLHEWLTISDRDTPVSENFESRAASFGVDLRQKYFAIVVEQTPINKQLNIPLSFNLDAVRTIYILRQFEQADIVLNQVIGPARMGVGTLHYDLSGTIREALQALCFSDTPIESPTVAYFKTTQKHEALRNSKFNQPELLARITSIGDVLEDTPLLDTFWTYTNTNHNVSETAKREHIHRKTVEYRLNRLRTITNFDPRDVFDNIALLAAYIQWRTRDLDILLAELTSISRRMLPRDAAAQS